MRDNSHWKKLETENEVYCAAFHYIQLHAAVTMNSDKVKEMIYAICDWSYAHRSGNGELTEEEQQARIDNSFDKIKKLVHK
jgi:hypothetical protein